MKQIALYLLIAGYFLAGINHFWHPKFYYRITPPFVGDAYWINVISGVAEIILAGMMIFPETRAVGGYLIVMMLLAFIPAHIYNFQVDPQLKVLLFIRLIVFQPLFIAWAWWVRN